MKQLARISFVLAFVLALPALKLYAQKPFEGTISWSMTIPMMGDDDKHSMVVNVKGSKTETETDMGAMGVIKSFSDKETNKNYIVMESMKMGYSMDIKNDSASQTNQSALDITPTGKKETIAGHPAAEYVLKGLSDNIEMSIWVTSDFPKDMVQSIHNALKSNPRQDSKATRAMADFAAKGEAPIRIVARKDGEIATTMEFVKLEEKKLDDSIFVLPTDIKFQPMPQMGGHGG